MLLRRVSHSVLPISFGSVYRVTHTHRHIHRGRKNTVKKIRDTLPGGGSEVHFILSPVRCQPEDAYQNTISGDRKDHSVIALWATIGRLGGGRSGTWGEDHRQMVYPGSLPPETQQKESLGAKPLLVWGWLYLQRSCSLKRRITLSRYFHHFSENRPLAFWCFAWWWWWCAPASSFLFGQPSVLRVRCINVCARLCVCVIVRVCWHKNSLRETNYSCCPYSCLSAVVCVYLSVGHCTEPSPPPGACPWGGWMGWFFDLRT